MVNMSTMAPQTLEPMKKDSSIDWPRICLKIETSMIQKDSKSEGI